MSTSSDVWRLILDSPADGATNMATDDALLESALKRSFTPTLRLYQWDPPCLSVGRFQPTTGIDRAALARRGVDLVRRPTGGRAILHRAELTYSIVIPANNLIARASVRESYRVLAAGLLRAVELLGLSVAMAPGRNRTTGVGSSSGGPERRADCFASPSDYEIVVDGRKLIGSAQMRRGGGLLQHGSILLGEYESPDAFFDGPGIAAEAPASLGPLLGRTVTPDEVAEAVAAGFQSVFEVALEPGLLTPEEIRVRAHRRQEIYANEDWTFQR